MFVVHALVCADCVSTGLFVVLVLSTQKSENWQRCLCNMFFLYVFCTGTFVAIRLLKKHKLKALCWHDKIQCYSRWYLKFSFTVPAGTEQQQRIEFERGLPDTIVDVWVDAQTQVCAKHGHCIRAVFFPLLRCLLLC